MTKGHPTMGTPMPKTVSHRTYASPLSFIGSLKRIANVCQKPDQLAWRIVLRLTFGVLALSIMWSIAVVVYVIMFLTPLGWFLLFWRFHRRAQRKTLEVQQQQLAAQQLLQETALTQAQAMQTLVAGQQHQIVAQQPQPELTPEPMPQLPPISGYPEPR